MSATAIPCRSCGNARLHAITVTRGAVSGLAATVCGHCGEERLIPRTMPTEAPVVPRKERSDAGRKRRAIPSDTAQGRRERRRLRLEVEAYAKRGEPTPWQDGPCVIRCTAPGCDRVRAWAGNGQHPPRYCVEHSQRGRTEGQRRRRASGGMEHVSEVIPRAMRDVLARQGRPCDCGCERVAADGDTHAAECRAEIERDWAEVGG